MITNARVLGDEFIPREIVHRDPETQELSEALRPLLNEEQPDPVFLSGPSGAGKTCIARHTLDQLREQVLDVKVHYVNCWQDYTRYRVLYALLQGIGKTLDIHRQSTPKDELLARLRDYDTMPYVVILDEVDQLEDQRVLYDLHSIENISLIMIANEEDQFFAGLDERVRSRFMSSSRIPFDKYGVQALTDILSDRAAWGLQPDAVTTAQLEEMADAAAGDARVAIGILRAAARIADNKAADGITDAMIDEAIPEGRQATRRKALDQLNTHQQALYEVVEEHGTITPGELYQLYEEKVDDPRSKRTLRTYLNKLCHYDLLAADGEKKGRTYRLQT